MSKYGKRAAGLLLTGVLCAGLLAGCGGAPEAAVTPTAPSESGSASGRRVETLRLEGGTDWGVPNPYLHQSRGPGTAKMRLVYGSLLEKDETGDVPWLAERWSMDGNDYTFTLFADAQFRTARPSPPPTWPSPWTTIRSTPRSPTPWGWGTAIWWTTIRWWTSRPSPSP